jgi:hypothetical protein
MLADAFQATMTLTDNWDCMDDDWEARAVVNSLANLPAPPFDPENETDLRFLLKNLHTNNAPGLDGITNRMLMHAPQHAIHHFVSV